MQFGSNGDGGFFQTIKDIWSSGKVYKDIISAIAGAAAAVLLLVRKRYNANQHKPSPLSDLEANFEAPPILKSIVSEISTVAILQPEISVTEFYHSSLLTINSSSYVKQEEIWVKVPRNVTFTPTRDAYGVQVLGNAIAKYYGKQKSIIYHRPQDPLAEDILFLCVGGADGNIATNEWWKPFRLPNSSDEFNIHGLLIQRGRIIFNAEYTSEEIGNHPDNEVIKDIGVVLYLHFHPKIRRPIVFLFGVWPFATYAAAAFVAGAISKTEDEQESFADHVRKGRSCFAIIQCDRQENYSFLNTVIDVQKLT